MSAARVLAGIGAAVATFFGLRLLFRKVGPVVSSSLNDRIVTEANRVIGLGATSDLDAFEDLLGGPGEDKGVELAMATYKDPKTGAFSSTCGLVVGGIWRRAGIKHPKLAPPYHVTTAISRLQEIAAEHGAWVTDVAHYTPEAGDTMMLDVDKPIGHVNTITRVQQTPTGWILTTVDGGALDEKQRQSVAQRTHTLTRQGNAMISRSSLGVVHNVTGFVHVRGLEPIAEAA